MSHNHMVISLGGTGGATMRALRKLLQQRHQSVNQVEVVAEQSERMYSNYDYIYIDSNSTDIASSKYWKTQKTVTGQSIGLGSNNVIDLSACTLSDRLDSLENFPITKKYIGDIKLWSEVRSNINLNNGTSGQVRRIGAAILEPKVFDFRQRIQLGVEELEAANKTTGVQFHVIAGISGGTGSGTFLQILAQIRSLYPFQSGSYPISLYITLPKLNDAERGKNPNYYANTYAALQELNAYLASDEDGQSLSSPIDFSGGSEKFEVIQGRIGGLKDRLQACYMVSCENEMGYSLGIDDLPDLIAQFIYQRTMVIDYLSNEYDRFTSAINSENAQVEGGRYKDFKAFGIKKIAVPEREIKDYLLISFSKQNILQLLYNNWDDLDFYLDYDKRNYDYSERVRDSALLSHWKISKDHVQLNKAILENENWNGVDITTFWERVREAVTERSSGKKVNLDLMNSIEGDYANQYDKMFRRRGVEQFFNDKISELKINSSHTSEILLCIDSWIKEEWSNGHISISEAEKLINTLIDSIDKRLSQIEDDRAEFNEIIATCDSELDKNRREVSNIGIFSRTLTKKSEVIYGSHIESITKKYHKKTLIASINFAEILLRSVRDSLLSGVKNDFAKIKAFLLETLEDFDNALTSVVQADINDSVNLVYDDALIKKATREMMSDKRNQELWSSRFRKTLLEKVNEMASKNGAKERFFHRWSNYRDDSKIKETMRVVSSENSAEAHQAYAAVNSSLYGVNILTKLREQYGDGESLRRYVDELVRSAQTLATFSHNEFDGGRPPEALLTVAIPNDDQHEQFRSKLESYFRAASSNNIKFVDSTQPEEIMLIGLKYAFPLRYLSTVTNYKASFDQRVASIDKEKALLQLYTQEHVRGQLPPILKRTYNETEELLVKLFAIGIALEAFVLQENKETGRNEYKVEHSHKEYKLYPSLVIDFLTQKSFSKPLKPADIRNSLQLVDSSDVSTLENFIKNKLSSDEFREYRVRKELSDKLEQQMEIVEYNQQKYTKDSVFINFINYIKSAQAEILGI